jgi:hypothetical protein
MMLLVPAALAAVTGAIVWLEASQYARENDQFFRGIKPRVAAAGGFLVAFVVGFVASPIVLGALVGYGLYREATLFEEEHLEPALDISALIWGCAGVVVGLFGALFTSTLLWAFVCSYVLLAGALYFAMQKNKGLRARRDQLLADNSALIAERTKLQDAARPAPKRTLESYERRRTPPAAVAAPTWATTPVGESDLLPRSR